MVITRRPFGSEVLLIQRAGAHGAGTWSVPGGWVDPGEDPIDAARRECEEEVGVELEREWLRFMGYTHSIHAEGVEDVCLWFHCHRGDAIEEPTIQEPDKIAELGWYRWDEIPEPLFLGFRQALGKFPVWLPACA